MYMRVSSCMSVCLCVCVCVCVRVCVGSSVLYGPSEAFPYNVLGAWSHLQAPRSRRTLGPLEDHVK